MEGVLSKWTNYLTGWQPRWFVLDNGILSYYESQDDVCRGSKGSMKMAVCEIKVHPTDNTRMELLVSGEQRFYLKAVNAAERQRWLDALCSAKAYLTATRAKGGKEIRETNEYQEIKMAELGLYCDLFRQQVQTIENFVHGNDTHSFQGGEMNEASSLLSTTCRVFLTTLHEYVKMAHIQHQPEVSHLPHPGPFFFSESPSPDSYSSESSLTLKKSEPSFH